jgi:hypothetical protein
MFYTDDACEDIMKYLDIIVQRTNERKMAGELAVAKKLPPYFGKMIGQYAGKRKTMKKRK